METPGRLRNQSLSYDDWILMIEAVGDLRAFSQAWGCSKEIASCSQGLPEWMYMCILDIHI